MANFFGTNGADSITESANFGFGVGTLSPFSNDVVFGNDGADTVIGHSTNGAALFVGGGMGDDSIVGGGGSATLGAGSQSVLRGDQGNDTIIAAPFGFSQILDGGSDNDSIVGSNQNDILLGDQGNDTLNALDGNDTVSGGDGNNVIDAGNGNDTVDVAGTGASQIAGGDGQDMIISVFNNGANTIDGGAANDSVVAGFGSERIVGGSGDDQIDGGGGANTILGETGNDRISAGSGNDSLVGGLNDTTDGNDTLDAGGGNNTVLGGFGNDSIVAGNGNDNLAGEDGNDSISAGEGANTISGGAGNDLIGTGNGPDSVSGGDGNDYVSGGAGNDTMLGEIGNDTLAGLTGNDSVSGGDGDDQLFGETGSDSLDGGIGNDIVDGGDGTDTLTGGEGNDRVLAGGSSDVILGSRGNDTLDGGDGFDALDYSGLGAGTRVIVTAVSGVVRVVKQEIGVGSLGTDSIAGIENFIATAGNDKLVGSGNDESFTAGQGNNTVDGGLGFDTVRYDFAGAGNVNANLLTGIAIHATGTDLLRRETGTKNFLEQVVAGSGADTLIGDSGDNFLRGNAGADSLDGGAGFDWADYSGDSSVTGVLANLSNSAVGGVAANSARDSSGSFDTLANFEALRGTDAADTLIGSSGDNLFRGQRGADSIDAGTGFDTADYRGDTDLNNDGFGVIVNLSNGAVTVPGFGAESNLVVGAQRGRDGWGDLDMLAGFEAVRGTNLNDVLVGTSRTALFSFGGRDFFDLDIAQLRGAVGADTLMAQDGDDSVMASYRDDTAGIVARLDLGSTIEDGFGTVDTLVNVVNVEGTAFDDAITAAVAGSFMRGRGGNDTLTGGAGFDQVSYAAAAAAVVVDLLAGTAQDGDGGSDSLSGSIEWVSGSRFADVLTGDADGTWFFGHAGADTINGGAGEDWVSYHSATQNAAVPIHVGIQANLQAGTVRDGDGSSATGSLDRLTSVEHLVGSVGADSIGGSSGANAIHGAAGADSIAAGAGADTVVGGTGADTVSGGANADRLEGGADADVFLFSLISESRGNQVDSIVDLELGVDDIAFGATAAAFSGVALTAINLNAAVNVAAANNTAAIYTAIGAAVGGSTATLEVAQVNVAGGLMAGTWIFANDAAAAATANDLLVRVTLVGGAAIGAGDLLLA